MKTVFSALFFLTLSIATFAQYDPKALQTLEEMSKKYKSISAFEANIAYTLINEVEKINEEFKGKIIVKGDKFRLSLPEQIGRASCRERDRMKVLSCLSGRLSNSA